MKTELEFLNNNIKDNTSVVVACSGGPDSMCLLSLVNNLKTTKKIKLICAHVNHKLRTESEEEAIMVQEYCQKNDIVFELLEITDYLTGDFSEEDARIRRYKFFDQVINKYKSKYLLTAHHGDDLIETILMRLTRGSNLSGYAGIRQVNTNESYQILRPLLTTTKEAILKYNNENAIPYRVDASNDNLKYTRNRYRHTILPFLKNEDANVHLKYLKFSKELSEYDNFVTEYIKNKKLIVDNSIDINKLNLENTFIKKKTIELIVKEIQKYDYFDISDNQMAEIIKLLDKNNKSIDLNNGYKCINEYGYLKIIKPENVNFTEIIFDKDVITKYFTFYYNSTEGDDSNNCIYLLSTDIKLPLKLRTKRDGDKMYIKNLNGSKKISDIFIDSKLPKEERINYPILVDASDTIIWLPGLKKSQFAKDKSEKYDIIIKCEAR